MNYPGMTADEIERHKIDCLARYIVKDICDMSGKKIAEYLDSIEPKAGKPAAKPIGDIPGLRDRCREQFKLMMKRGD